MTTHSLSEITHFGFWDYTLVSVEVNRSAFISHLYNSFIVALWDTFWSLILKKSVRTLGYQTYFIILHVVQDATP